MTREEAIEVLKDIYNYTRFDTYTTNEARTMAIKALEQEPIYYPPCQDCHTKMDEIVRAYDNVKSLDDAVSRQEVMELLNKRYCHKEPYERKEGNTVYKGYDTYYMINFDKLKALPPVLPKHKQGEWIQKEYWSEGCGMGETYGYYYECSKCGNLKKGDYKRCGLNYCPNCGAEMR